MKKLIEHVEDEGLISLMGETVTLFCINYFYTGRLVGVNSTCVLIEGAKIIYDTGKFSDKSWANAQDLHADKFYVQIDAIESFGVMHK